MKNQIKFVNFSDVTVDFVSHPSCHCLPKGCLLMLLAQHYWSDQFEEGVMDEACSIHRKAKIVMYLSLF